MTTGQPPFPCQHSATLQTFPLPVPYLHATLRCGLDTGSTGTLEHQDTSRELTINSTLGQCAAGAGPAVTKALTRWCCIAGSQQHEQHRKPCTGTKLLSHLEENSSDPGRKEILSVSYLFCCRCQEYHAVFPMDHLGGGAGGISEVALQLADRFKAVWHRAGQGISLTNPQRVCLCPQLYEGKNIHICTKARMENTGVQSCTCGWAPGPVQVPIRYHS